MIAINMKMPESCNFCRFEMEDGSCRVMPIDYKEITWDCLSDDRPDWCPLRQVDRLVVEHMFAQEDFDRYGKDTIKKYLVDTAGRKIGDKIVSDKMCEWESKPIDPEIMPDGTRVRTTVCVVRPEICGGVCDLNKQLQKVMLGLEHHAGLAEWRCWQDNGDIMPNEYCSYFEENECVTQLTKDAIELLKEYDSALRGMVYQYCTAQKQFLKGKDCDQPNQEVFFHSFVSAGEEAFRVLDIENGQEVTDEFIWS